MNCECGCGGQIKKGRRFLWGHYMKLFPTWKGKVIPDEIREKIRKTLTGRKVSPETIEKVRKANTGKKRTLETRLKMSINNCMRRPEIKEKVIKILQSDEHRERMRKASTGRIVTKETREKLSRIHKGKKKPYMVTRMLGVNNPMKRKEIQKKVFDKLRGRKFSKARRKMMSKIFKGRVLSPEHCASISRAIKNLGDRHPMRRPEIKAIQMKKWARTSGLKEPNKPEKYLNSIIQKLFPDEYKLNTRKDVLVIGNKVPDFVNINGQKKLIELYGDYWHRGQDPKVKINYYKKFGWDTLVIWEKELKLNNNNKLEEKLVEFHIKSNKIPHPKNKSLS